MVGGVADRGGKVIVTAQPIAVVTVEVRIVVLVVALGGSVVVVGSWLVVDVLRDVVVDCFVLVVVAVFVSPWPSPPHDATAARPKSSPAAAANALRIRVRAGREPCNRPGSCSPGRSRASPAA